MAGVGIDLLEIERLEKALARRPRLAQRLFTDGEIAYAQQRPQPVRHLAARFCAKEAVAKSLSLTAWDFTDVEVVREDDSPSVRLAGRAAEAAQRARVEVTISLTHTDTTAGAVALAMPASGGNS